MSASFGIFDVHRVEISAYSAPLSGIGGKSRMHCQRLELFDATNQKIGDVTLYLDQPLSAIAIGDLSQLDGFVSPPVRSTPVLHSLDFA